MLTILLALLAAASNAVSSVLQRSANLEEARSGDKGAATILHLLRRPAWLAGFAAVIVSFGLQAAALSMGQLAQVQPIMALELPITLMLASRVFHQRLRRRDWMAVVAMAGGMSLFLLALQPTAGTPGGVPAREWVLGAGVTSAVVVLLAVAAWGSGGRRRAALLGVASGVSFALTAVFIASVLDEGLSWSVFSRWELYCVAVAGLAAILFLQWGMQAGSLVVVQPGVTLADPVVAVILGVLLFSERVRTGGWIVAEVAGMMSIAAGTIELSRSPVVEVSGGPAGSDLAGGRGQDGGGTGTSESRPAARE